MNLLIIILIYLGLTVWDGVLTFQILKRPKAKEWNPFMRLYISAPWKFYAVKILFVIIIGIFLYFMRNSRSYLLTIIGCGFFFILPVALNLIEKHRRK